MRIFTIILLISQSTVAAQSYRLVSAPPSDIPASTNVNYVCTLFDMWTEERHPAEFPDNPHWSSPVIVAHTAEYSMWAEGELASTPMERLAEEGRWQEITDEIRDFQPSSAVGTPSVGFTFYNSVHRLIPPFQVTADRHYISSATMVAPSPDWFSGLSQFDALNQTTNTWHASFRVDAYPWDAGTEAGVLYDFFGTAEDPHQPIFRITENTLPATDNQVFLNPDVNGVLPVTRWDCRITRRNDIFCGPVCITLRLLRSLGFL